MTKWDDIQPKDVANSDQIIAAMKDARHERGDDELPITVDVRFVMQESESLKDLAQNLISIAETMLSTIEARGNDSPLVGGAVMGSYLVGDEGVMPVGIITAYLTHEQMHEFLKCTQWRPGDPIPEFPEFIVPDLKE